MIRRLPHWSFLILAICRLLSNDSGVDKIVNSDQLLSELRTTVRVGHEEIPPGNGASSRIVRAVEKSLPRGRLEGLPDDLNPVILDPAKVQAFLTGLSKVPKDSLKALRDKILYLNDPALQLHASSAVSPSELQSGFQLKIESGRSGEIASVTVKAPIDERLARDRATRARETMQEMDRKVQLLERKPASSLNGEELRELSLLRAKRYAAASVWRDLVSALAARRPDNAALRSEDKAAKKAASQFIVAPWTGMPSS
jgi:hypothetical protein